MACYVAGLRFPIHGLVILHDLARVDDTYCLAVKIESQLSRSTARRTVMGQGGSSSTIKNQIGGKVSREAQNLVPPKTTTNVNQFEKNKGILDPKPSRF